MDEKMYIKENGTRLRIAPDTSKADGVIKTLDAGAEVKVLHRWLEVDCADMIGLIREDLLTSVKPNSTQSFTNLDQNGIFVALQGGSSNLAGSEITKALRKFIDYEFKFADDPSFQKTQLQCTEYVQFRVKQKLGINIQWLSTERPRNGRHWGSIFQKNGRYEVLDLPISDCAMSFMDGFKKPSAQENGHIAFVEEAYPDESILISEANWDERGTWGQRKLSKTEWRNQWGARFIKFI